MSEPKTHHQTRRKLLKAVEAAIEQATHEEYDRGWTHWDELREAHLEAIMLLAKVFGFDGPYGPDVSAEQYQDNVANVLLAMANEIRRGQRTTPDFHEQVAAPW